VTIAASVLNDVVDEIARTDRAWWLAWWMPWVWLAGGAVAAIGSAVERARSVLLPAAVALVLIAVWDGLLVRSEMANVAAGKPIGTLIPRLGSALEAYAELHASGRLWPNVFASLFRVTWGYLLAAAVGIPLGLAMGWYSRTFTALNPLMQALRPISPLAWIPLAIIWFGIGDAPAVFLIFLASVFPIATGASTAVRAMSTVHQRAARNFNVRGFELFRRVIFPAALPQILTSMRLALGIAWLVIVAAEMVGMDSGLGYLVWDARNQGMRADVVVATMMTIGAIGIALDLVMRRFELFDEVRWGFGKR
jgi:NitT/TauT family transport system permease protein